MFLKRFFPVLLVLLFVGGVVVWRQPQSVDRVSRTALIMGTVVDIQAYGDDEKQLSRAVDAAFGEMTRLERLLSRHIPESDISRLSEAVGGIELSSETVGLLEMGQKVSRQSSGAFDMTLGAVKKLWNIEGENPRIPTAAELSEALAGTGPSALTIAGNKVTKTRPEVAVDLGGIAKGYAVDRAVNVLAQAGVASATVNAGGDIRLLGGKKGEPWRIGIQHPRQADGLLVTLRLQDRAVVTSGDYERFFEQNGQRYHHIFDPATGKPARQCQSVTVVAAGAAHADALATAAFVLGPVAGLNLLEGLPDVEGLIVGADGRLFKTSGLPE